MSIFLIHNLFGLSSPAVVPAEPEIEEEYRGGIPSLRPKPRYRELRLRKQIAVIAILAFGRLSFEYPLLPQRIVWTAAEAAGRSRLRLHVSGSAEITSPAAARVVVGVPILGRCVLPQAAQGWLAVGVPLRERCELACKVGADLILGVGLGGQYAQAGARPAASLVLEAPFPTQRVTATATGAATLEVERPFRFEAKVGVLALAGSSPKVDNESEGLALAMGVTLAEEEVLM